MQKPFIVLVVGVFTALAAPAQVRGSFTIEDLFLVKSVGEATVSPDGAAVAYTLSQMPNVLEGGENGPPASEVHVAFGPNEERLYFPSEKSPSNLRWRSAGVLTFLADVENDRKNDEKCKTALYAISTSGGAATELFQFDDCINDYNFANEGATLFFSAQDPENSNAEELRKKGFDANIVDETARFTRLYRADLTLATPKAAALNLPGNVSSFSVSPDGSHLVVALAETPLIDDELVNRIFHIINGRSGKVQSRISSAGKIGKVRFSPDGNRIAFLAGIDRSDPVSATVAVADAETGKFKFLTDGDDADEIDFVWIDNERLRVLAHRGAQSEAYTLSVAGEVSDRQSHDGFVVSALGGEAGAYAASASAPTHPSALYVERDGVGLTKWSDHNPWIADRDLGDQRVVEWTARDGERIQGILITPKGRAPRGGWPLITFVHGGPEAHHSNDWLTTYMRPGHIGAGEGFAVLYPNYRGSTGRGQAFAKLDHANPPAAEFDDIVDGIDHLADQGLVNAKKVGITGASYGGFASAWGATALTERFAASVAFVGLTDLVSFIGGTEIPVEMVESHFQKYPEKAWQMYTEQSPIYHAAKSKTPTLILHGEADTRVDPSQSLELFRYLKRVGQAPVRYVTYPGEQHGNVKAAARYDYALRMMRWMKHYLKGKDGPMPPVTLPEIEALAKKDK